jgi:hypothetical protein
MTDYLFEGIGGGPVPPELETGEVTAVTLDPARATLAGLFKQVLNSELGAAWTQVVTALGSSHRLYGTSPVQGEVLQLRPSPQVLKERKNALPMLCIYRTGRATFEDHTIAQDKLVQPWELIWIVGQATVEEQRRLGDSLVQAAKSIRLATRRRGHPDYESGALQFFPDSSGDGGIGAVAVQWVETDPVRLNEEGQMDWLIMRMGLETVEYGSWDSGAYGSVDQMTLEMGVGDATGIIPSFIHADSRYPESDPRP